MSKTEQIKCIYEFGPFRLDSAERVLRREGRPVILAPKLFDTLLALVERSGHIVEKADLMEIVWPDTFVEESNLSSSISLLRKALGEAESGKSYIETVARRGYRFTEDVTVFGDTTDIIMERHSRMHVVTREEEVGPKQEEINRESATVSTQESTANSSRLKRQVLILTSAVVIVVAVVVLIGLRYINRNVPGPRSAEPFARMRMTRLTTNGRAGGVDISPDGKFAVYAMRSAEGESLWLKHIATGSDQQILPGSLERFGGLTFSPDGNHIYFISSQNTASGPAALFQMSIFGGSPRKLLSDIDSRISFSPDGKRFAFMRGDPSRRKRFLIVAKADGTEEQMIATHELEDLFLVAPAWSPNGETIVFPQRGSGPYTPYGNLLEIRLKDGVEKPITSEQWSSIRAISWLHDGSGLITVAGNQEQGSNSQIWYVPYPSGKVRRITNDLNDYFDVGVSADASTLITLQNERASDIWVTDSDASGSRQITSTRSDGLGRMSWTPDGRVVYVSRASGNPEIWISNHDGSGKKQLTFDEGWDTNPFVSGDGHYIVFISTRLGKPTIWRMDIDGGNQKQLTSGMSAAPECTPDNKWVIYTNSETPPPTLWKVPIEGGNSVRVTDYMAQLIAVSPADGQIAYTFLENNPNRRRVAIIPLEGGSPRKVFDFTAPFGQAVRWSFDGRALNYINVPSRTSIWSQPLDGSPPKQIIDFKSDQIFSFAWSRDGKHLAVTRGNRSSDVVVIRDQP